MRNYFKEQNDAAIFHISQLKDMMIITTNNNNNNNDGDDNNNNNNKRNWFDVY